MQIGELSAFSTLDYQNYRDIFNLDLKYLINRINAVVKSFLHFFITHLHEEFIFSPL